MGDMMEELKALRRNKEKQSAAMALAQEKRWQEMMGEGDEGQKEGASVRQHNPLLVPPSISGVMVVDGEEGEVTANVELRGPFLIYYPLGHTVEDSQEVTRNSMVGADVREEEGDVVIVFNDKLLRLVHKGNDGPSISTWTEHLKRAARQDARRSTQAQDVGNAVMPATSTLKMDDVTLEELVGKGTYGEVWRAVVKNTGRTVAVKMGRGAVARTREQSLLLEISCPFIISAEAIFSYDGAPCIVMPLLEGGDLDLHLDLTPEGYFTKERAMFHAAEILCALDYLHSKGIVYRDLKPENVVLDREGHTVLTDMGHARSLSSTSRAETFCGTAEYLAPEILNSDGHTHAVDHWALGVLLFEMSAGTLPFQGTEQDVFDSILLSEPTFPAYVAPDTRDLITKLLRKQPTSRLSSPAIHAHAFFSPIDWKLIETKSYPPPFVPDIEEVRRLTRRKLRN
eukprot:TRINITY_DN1668_c0_g1_i1.p1 TRINITY_DN1668_c0_g1~~TRINITY_DN1668_c0_g1_i1.p1  ORF type:complete len:455 (+),score=72.01 TRINITY_DN1668_c0_g1_i1:83-1447(+)